jgi:hypothetical protein
MTFRTLESHFACLVGGVCAGVLIMWSAGQEQRVKADLKGAQYAIAFDRKADAITATVSTETAQETIRIQYRTREVIRYVPQILNTEIVDRYPLPDGFIRVHDAAVSSEIPGPARELDGAASDIGADQALGVIVGNVGQCHEWRAQLIGLQDWVRQQQALSEGAVK